ncbi:MAG TPA: tetratricopeptide repeat protein [Allosphingosinicella sp.]|jgi:putative PEP-CTERM system TPR-repeat lipoprotein
MTKPQLLLACALMAGLAACSNALGSGDPKAAIARGEQALREGQPRTARIEFLNAIKVEPNNPRLRLLQAETYLKLGDGVAAEAEVSRARQIGIPVDQTRHLLAHALLLQTRNDEAVKESVPVPPRFAAYAARIRGQAQMNLGEIAGAAEAFDAAVAAAPEDPAVWTDIARFRRSIGNTAGALAAADQAVKLRPNDIEAITMRGELTRSQYGLAAALPWFDRALEVDGTYTAARLEKAATLGDMGRMGDMLAETRRVLETSPSQPMAYYLQAMLAARARKFDLARSLYQKTGGALDEQPAGMLLASAIEFQTGAVEQAVGRLQRLVAMQPENRKARRLLAAAFWKRGDVESTIQTLQSVADRPDADNYSLSLLANAYEKQGDSARASQLLARASRPQRPSQAALLAPPMNEAQVTALRKLAAAKPDEVQAQVLLIGALLSRGESAEALDRARRLQARNPGAADAHLLVGDALGVQGNIAGAAQEYRKAANLSFTEPVAMRLIEALRRSRQGPAAAQVLQLFLQQNPRNVSAMLLAANGFMEMGKWAEAIRIYEGIRGRLGDRDTALLNNLAYAYGEQGDWDKAIPLAQKAWSLDKNNPATTDTLGWLLYKSGKDRARGLAMMEAASRGAPTDKQIQAHLNRAKKG